MKIVLARHGETDWNASNRFMGRIDIPLNEQGKEQALTLKEKLAEYNFDCCFCSSLSRAKETAEIVCDGKCDVVCDDDVMERSGGDLEGKVVESWEEFSLDKTKESDEELFVRAKRFLERLKQTDYDCVLIVSHNGLLNNLRYCILENQDELEPSYIPNCGFEVYEISKD